MTGNDAPKGWINTSLADVAEVTMGQSPPSSTYNDDGIGLPFYQGKADFGPRHPHVRKWCSQPTKIGKAGDILMSVRAPVGPVNVCQEPSCIGRGLAAITCHDGVEMEFIFHYLRSIESEIASLGTGTTFSAISGEVLRNLRILLPPAAEQRRIVAKIEELLTDLDVGLAALHQAKRLVAQYRQAALKAAVEGELSRNWREANADTIEPAELLLSRLLRERRERWEREQLASLTAKGQQPKNESWKAKYSEPDPPTTADLPVLPSGWTWATLEQLSWDSSYGTSEKCDYNYAGPGVLRIPNIANGTIDLSNLKRASADFSLAPQTSVQAGDLLVIRTNGSKNLIGRAAVTIGNIESPLYFASYLIRYRLQGLESGLPQWIGSVWHSYRIRQWIERIAATSAGQYNVSMSALNRLAIELPPPEEQIVILDELTKRMAGADELEVVLNREILRAGKLRQSILKQAFTGQLVPQDPTDEPVEKLLERIREAKQYEKPTAKRSRTPGKKEVAHV